MGKKMVVAPLTEEELDAVTVVFHQYETGLREGTIYTRVGHLVICCHVHGHHAIYILAHARVL